MYQRVYKKAYRWRKSVLTGLIDKVKDKVSKSDEKLQKEPRMSEFEMVHKQELRKERDQGMER